jgi:VanZ family protein
MHSSPTSPPRLALYLALAYALLAIYGSLHPFTDWRDTGSSPIDFLFAGWSRYITGFDLAVNVLAYLPLGLFWFVALRPRWGGRRAALAALCIGTAISLAMEMLQNYLPSRVPSNIDVACNALGTLLGATLGLRWGAALVDGGRLHALRQRLVLHGGTGDAGLMLVGLWLLTQLNPETLLFGNGDLRILLDLPAPLTYNATRFTEFETLVVGAHTLAAALLAGGLCRVDRRVAVALLLLGALVAKSFVLALSLGGARGFAWATPGSLAGLAMGTGLWLTSLQASARLQRAIAALALLIATVLVNLAPENPYIVNTWHTWNPGQFLNFLGLTKLASTLWPFLALTWLMLLRGERTTELSR